MKIVVLDGHTTSTDRADWQGLFQLGEVDLHEYTPPEQVAETCQGAAAIITNKTLLSAELLRTLPELRYVGLLSTGVNVVDLPAADAAGVTVCNVPAYSTPSVAQATWALLLELTNHVGIHAASVSKGDWARQRDFCYWLATPVELQGLTLGLVGYGGIGQAVAAIGRAFGMRILVHTRTPRNESGVSFVDLETLLAEADVVSLHCPLTETTAKLIDGPRLARMKSSAYLINTSRGGLIDEQALADALNAGGIAGAGLDVLSTEPPTSDNPLPRARNCVITPHIAWATRAARMRLLQTVVDNLRGFQSGAPINVVNQPGGGA